MKVEIDYGTRQKDGGQAQITQIRQIITEILFRDRMFSDPKNLTAKTPCRKGK